MNRVEIQKKKIVTQILISNLNTTADWLSIAWAGIDVNSQKRARAFNYAFGLAALTFLHGLKLKIHIGNLAQDPSVYYFVGGILDKLEWIISSEWRWCKWWFCQRRSWTFWHFFVS